MVLDNHRLFLAYEAVFCPCFITYSEKVNEPYRSLIKRLLLLNFPQSDPRFWFAPTRWLAIPTPIGLTVRTSSLVPNYKEVLESCHCQTSTVVA